MALASNPTKTETSKKKNKSSASKKLVKKINTNDLGKENAFIVIKVSETNTIKLDGVFIGQVNPTEAKKLVVKPGVHTITAYPINADTIKEYKILAFGKSEHFIMIGKKYEQEMTMTDLNTVKPNNKTYFLTKTFHQDQFEATTLDTGLSLNVLPYQAGMVVSNRNEMPYMAAHYFNFDVNKPFRLELVIEWKKGSRTDYFGLVNFASGVNDYSTGNLLLINAVGDAGLASFNDSKMSWLCPMKSTDYVNPSAYVNTLTIKGNGAWVDYKVNGRIVKRISNKNLKGNKFGYYVSGRQEVKVVYMALEGNATILAGTKN